MFLVLEGLDGSGTTTQQQRLANWLTAHDQVVHPTAEPSTGPVGRWIRATLRGEEGAPAPQTLPWMFAADRADHLAREIEPALEAGQVVLCDRYLHSSLAYQGLQAPLDHVWGLNETFRVPDLTLFVDVPAAVSMERIEARGGDRELFEKRERLEAIRDSYHRVIERLRDRGDRIVVIDGAGSRDDVTAALQEALGTVGLP